MKDSIDVFVKVLSGLLQPALGTNMAPQFASHWGAFLAKCGPEDASSNILELATLVIETQAEMGSVDEGEAAPKKKGILGVISELAATALEQGVKEVEAEAEAARGEMLYTCLIHREGKPSEVVLALAPSQPGYDMTGALNATKSESPGLFRVEVVSVAPRCQVTVLDPLKLNSVATMLEWLAVGKGSLQ